MSKRKDGGAAFPGTLPISERGMTLRQYYAGQALAGILANPNLAAIETQTADQPPGYQIGTPIERWYIVGRCVSLADALIARLEGKQTDADHAAGGPLR